MELKRQMPEQHDVVTFYINSDEFNTMMLNHTANEFVAQRLNGIAIKKNDLIVIYVDHRQTHNLSAELMRQLMKSLVDQLGCKVICMPTVAHLSVESKKDFIDMLKATIIYLEKGDDENN